MIIVDDVERRTLTGLKVARRHLEASTSRLEHPLGALHAGGCLQASGEVGKTILEGFDDDERLEVSLSSPITFERILGALQPRDTLFTIVPAFASWFLACACCMECCFAFA